MKGPTRLLLWIVGLGAFAAGAIFGFPLLTKDAFGTLRQKGPLGDKMGIKLEDVEMKVYDKDKLTAQSNIGTVSIGRDRNLFDFDVISGSSGSGKDKIDFKSKQAQYDTLAATLKFGNGIQLKSENFDLSAPKMTIDDRFKNMQAPGPMKGTLYGGAFLASSIKYTFDNKRLKTGSLEWQGKLPGVIKDNAPTPQGKTMWNIQSKESESENNISKYVDARATDGDQLIRAKNVEFDNKKDILIATGPAYYYGEDVNLVADKITVFRKEKRVLLVGNVRMLVKPENQADIAGEIPPMRPDVPDKILQNRPAAPSSEEASQQKDLDSALTSSKTIRDYPALVQAATITYWYKKGERRADISGKPECLQDLPSGRWRRVFADTAHYNGEAETFRVNSAPGKRDARLKTSLGHDLTATWFEISTKESDKELGRWKGADVAGDVPTDDDDDIPTKTGGGGGGGTGGGATGTTGTTGGG